MSKKKIIAIVSIIVLLFAAGISVGVFLYGRGETEATEGNQTTEQDQVTDGNQFAEGTPAEDNNENETTPETGDEETTLPGEGGNVADAEEDETVENDRENADNEVVNNDNETVNTTTPGVTTGTNVNEVGETTITRVEEQERLISKGFWDWWQPMAVEITPTEVGVEIPQITVKKAVITGVGGDQFVYAGQAITYVIAVTNNSEQDVQNIEITDKIPQNTTFVSIEDAIILNEVDGKLTSEVVGTKTIIKNEDTVEGLKWIVTIPTGETVIARFTVNVNETTGTILNTAIANGEESNEGDPTKTSIIKTQKSSVITRNDKEVEIAKIGDLITYTITVENTGDVEGTTYITDKVPEGTKFVSAQDDAKVSEKQDLIAWTITVPAGEKITREFTVEVIEVNGTITNIANVGGTDTEEDRVETKGIEVEKTATKVNGEEITAETKVMPNDVISYIITVTNTGSVTLADVVVTDDLVPNFNEVIEFLEPEASKNYVVEYTVTQEDVDNNAEITNIATATSEDITNEGKDDKVLTDKTATIDVQKFATKVNGEEITTETKV